MPQPIGLRSNLPLLGLSFLFLTLVLAFNGYQQWQSDQRAYATDVERTLDTYARQTSLITQAGIHANQMFTQSHAAGLAAMTQPSLADNNRLWYNLSNAFFNLTAALIFTSAGDYLAHLGDLLDPLEIQDIQRQLHQHTSDIGIFSLRYPSGGGYYIVSRFSHQGDDYIFISRRLYSELSRTIYNGNFKGFEVALIERKTDAISIRQHFYANTATQPTLSEHERHNMLHRSELAFTPWDIVALPIEGYQQGLLRQRIMTPLFVLLFFTLLVTVVWHFIRRQERVAIELDNQRRASEQRADRTLMSIDEALISTNADGIITYANPKAAALLHEHGLGEYLGQPLQTIWPDPNALWNKNIDSDELDALHHRGQHIDVIIGQEKRILEQAYNPLYNGREITDVVWLLRDVTDTVLAVRAMEESRRRYKALFEEAGVAHLLLNVSKFDGDVRDVTLIGANDAALKLIDAHSQKQLLNEYRSLLKGHGNTLQATIQSAIDQQLASMEFEFSLRTFRGRHLDLWANLSVRTGSPGQALVTVLDVTQQKQASRESREREAFWSSVTAVMPDLVYVIELNSQLQQRIIFKNRTMGEMLGYPTSIEAKEQPWIYYADPEELSRLSAELAAIRELPLGSSRTKTARFRHHDGRIRILKFNDTPFTLDNDGKVQQYIGTARDVTDEIEQQELIVESERRYRLLAENMSDIIWAADASLKFTFVSSSSERLLGYKPDELLRNGVGTVFKRPDVRILFHELRLHIQRAMNNPESAKKFSQTLQRDITATTKTGASVLLELQASLLWNDQGELQGLMGLCRDVTEQRRIEQDLKLAAEVFESSNEAILITDQNMNIASINKAFTTITGYLPENILGRTPDFLISNDKHSIDFFEQVGRSLTKQGYWQGELFYQPANGEERTGWAGISAITDQDRNIQSLILIMSDITERKVIEERIQKLAYFDPLTGLPNRSQMNERFEHMLDDARKNNQGAALLFIDLDRFKPINDSMGHPAGDQVLKEVAQRLQQCIKKHDLAARMGGDEFVVGIGAQANSDKAADTAIKVAERILHTLNAPYKLGQREVFISCSIGISMFPTDGDNVMDLLKNSDMAMYHAKSLGRDNVQFFNPQMNEKAVELLELENDLRQALARDELELYFQPQYQSDTGVAVGVEALLRWNHPHKGIISPGVFIPIIEDTGLIVPIGRWVLEQACAKYADWQQNHQMSLQRIAVNVSARQFKQLDFLDMVKEILHSTGIHPSELELELTESILIDNVEHTLSVLNGLRDMGVQTAIDDFGTGYSSLNYLKQFPVDTLKIDRSFIQNLPHNKDDAQITRTIIAMAHNLGMGVIAEGVETQAQLDFLIQSRCEEVQGFLFSKPVTEQHLLNNLQPDPH